MGAIKDLCNNVKAKEKERLYAELGITEESLRNDVLHLKIWMSKQPHFPKKHHLNLDKWLENQLILSKNSMERTKANIDKYFSARTMIPSLFEGKDPTDNKFTQSFENMSIALLPGHTSRMYKVIVIKIESPEADKFNFETHIKRTVMNMEYMLKEAMDFTALHVVFDLQNFRISHLSRFNVSLMRTMSLTMKAFPTRVAVISLVNYPSFIEKAITVFRPFISAKLLDRINFVKDLDELTSDGGVSWPKEYNSQSSFTVKDESDVLRRHLVRLKDYIFACDKLVSDETKRMNKDASYINNTDSLVTGSFRKLCID